MIVSTTDLPDYVRLKVVHLHKDNSSRNQRRHSEYLTIARVVTTAGEVLAEAFAKCRSTDRPSRSTGYSVAVGRVLKQYSELA